MNKHFYKYSFGRFFTIFLAVFFLLNISYTESLSALSAEQRRLFNNGIYFYDPNSDTLTCVNGNAKSTSGGPVTQLVGEDVIGKIFNYFTARGLTPFQAAGLMGNIQEESGFQADNQQNSSAWPSAGWGLIQWTGGRRTAIAAAMTAAGIGDLYSAAYADGKTPPERQDELLLFQLDYLWQEFQTTHKSSYEGLVAAQNVRDATDVILVRFEHPFAPSLKWDARQSDPRWIAQMDKRTPHSEAILSKYGNGPNVDSETVSVAGGNAKKTVIALDPGHGGEIAEYVDSVTGLADRETPNSPERENVLEVAKRIKAELDKIGYDVVLLRTEDAQIINKRERVDKAIASQASLVVSIHTAPGVLDQVWPQRVGTYRQFGDKKVTITNEEVAKKSQTYADAIAKAREASEGHPISLDENNSTQLGSFNGDRTPSKGNVSLVQLWGQDIPWVYNEISQDPNTTAIGEETIQKYTTGLINGIKAAVPATITATSGACGGQAFSDKIAETAFSYAWPIWKGVDVTAKPEYVEAYTTARSEGRYIGGTNYPGIDCGGFITTLMVDSGWEVNYNDKGADTAGQYTWLQQNWEDLGSAATIDTATLRPGDVAVTRGKGHTFMFVGNIANFDSQLASASWDERAPMADTKQSPNEARFQWFRKR